MTRTTSIKHDLRQGLTVFGYQLKKSRTPLIIFAVIAGFLTTAILSLTLVSANAERMGFEGADAAAKALAASVDIFQATASAAVFILTCIFTIIYTLRVFSYLHNKRKADWINPLPVKSGVLFLGKAAAAFAAAVVPALFFLGIICLITLCCGGEVNGAVLRLFLQIPLGSIACISFYGLMAVCCGSSVNTVLSFLAICFCYPLAAQFIRGMAEAFFCGMPSVLPAQSFLFKALNPLAAYDGANVVYWLLFTAGCFVLSVVLLRRRKAERAQTSFAFRLPCYAVEMLVTFIAGMLMGTVFGSLKVLFAPFAGFLFGFLLGGGTAFLVAHVILFKGFARILKSLIFFGAVTAAAVGFTAVCALVSPAYVNYLPDRDAVERAGYVAYDTDMQVSSSFGSAARAVQASADDWDSADDIDMISQAHSRYVAELKKRGTANCFRNTLTNSFANGVFAALGYNDEMDCYAYRMKDGSVITRCYSPRMLEFGALDYILNDADGMFDSFSPDSLDAITSRPAYLQKYSLIAQLSAQDVSNLQVDADIQGNYRTYQLNGDKAQADREKLFTAFREDYLSHEKPDDADIRLVIEPDMTRGGSTPVIFSLFGADKAFPFFNYHSYPVPASYTRTLQVMREIGIIKENGRHNVKSPYLVSGIEETTAYQKGDMIDDAVRFTLPWDCTCVNTIQGRFFTRADDDELLLFQSHSKENFSDDAYDSIRGYDDSNVFADSFTVIGIESKEKQSYGCFGKAKVLADGKEMVLRFVQYDTAYGAEVYFATDLVTDEEYQTLTKRDA